MKAINNNNELFLDKKQQLVLLKLARQTLTKYLFDGQIPVFETNDQQLNRPRGVFVTLWLHNYLRGCIGTIYANLPLFKTVQSCVINAAIHDGRFSSVGADELKTIKIEISLLTTPKKIVDWKNIHLGNEGVIVKKGERTGIFLPQVAIESGWTLEEFLSHLCQDKANLPRDAYRDKNTTLLVFTAQIFKEN